jgi:hypothetical protein
MFTFTLQRTEVISIRVDGKLVPARVLVQVDAAFVARVMGGKASRNANKKSRIANGAVCVTLLESKPESYSEINDPNSKYIPQSEGGADGTR